MSSTITAGKFTYSSLGLLYELEPRCTQTAITKRLSTGEQVNVRWLKAQLAHYGLKPLTGTKDELEARLKKAVTEGKVKAPPKDMKEMEKGLKAAFEARSGAGKSKVEKKKPAAAAAGKKEIITTTTTVTTTTTLAHAATAKKKSVATSAKKKEAALSSALAAASKVPASKPAAAKAAAKPKAAPAPSPAAASKPRVSFADQLLGTYTVTTPTFPNYSSSLKLFRHATEPKLSGTLDLGGCQVRAAITLDWLPMAKQSRVPFSEGGVNMGEMEFSVMKGIAKVKGKVHTRMWGEVEWSGVKTEVKKEVKGEVKEEEGAMDWW
jgi:hypothetical protein